jgi:hypothetical protein
MARPRDVDFDDLGPRTRAGADSGRGGAHVHGKIIVLAMLVPRAASGVRCGRLGGTIGTSLRRRTEREIDA